MELADLNRAGIYSYADYLKWNFKERVELIRGKIFAMSPSPNPYHQVISMEISGRLWSFLAGKKCKVYPAPFDVRLQGKGAVDKDVHTVVQPDISVVCDASKIDARGCAGAPDIVVEILSPSNNEKELNYKYDLYEQAGIKEYWVVFPGEKTIIVYSHKGEKYDGSKPYTPGTVLTSAVLPGLSLLVADIFS